jgi:S-adenosylmethionine:tRNA ribosyltransferase-isomerase
VDLADFDYLLPPERIAQAPLEDRAASRMLVLRRGQGRWEDRQFRELPQFLAAGDCLVLNDSRVFPARLFGRRIVSGKRMRGRVQVFLVRPLDPDARTWECLVHPGRKMRTGERIQFAEGFEGRILARAEHGERTIQLECEGDVYEWIERTGEAPLPLI